MSEMYNPIIYGFTIYICHKPQNPELWGCKLPIVSIIGFTLLSHLKILK